MDSRQGRGALLAAAWCGTFAVTSIRADEVVEVWGECSHGEQTVAYTDDPSRIDNARRTGLVVMQWDYHLYSIEAPGSDEGYFINHSCDPNLWFRDAFTLVARRAVSEGDELTLDYALFEADRDWTSAWACVCGSSQCRGTITGRDWQRPELQGRYAEHFTPLFNKRIARHRRDPDE
jgi:SET domain-containing protein